MIRYAAANKVIITDENKLIGLSCKMSQKQQRNHKTCTKAKIIPGRFKKFKDNKKTESVVQS